MAAINPMVVVENPMSATAIPTPPNAKANGTLLSNRATSQPEMGRPMNEQMGGTIRMFPSWASLKSKADCIVGIREVQEEKQTPDKKKNALSANRCLCFNSIAIGRTLCQ